MVSDDVDDTRYNDDDLLAEWNDHSLEDYLSICLWNLVMRRSTVPHRVTFLELNTLPQVTHLEYPPGLYDEDR